MSTEDWVAAMFPGDPLELPADAERDKADHLIEQWSKCWSEEPFAIARILVPREHPDTSEEGYANALAGTPTNRAYLRSQLRRWWRRPGPRPT